MQFTSILLIIVGIGSLITLLILSVIFLTDWLKAKEIKKTNDFQSSEERINHINSILSYRSNMDLAKVILMFTITGMLAFGFIVLFYHFRYRRPPPYPYRTIGGHGLNKRFEETDELPIYAQRYLEEDEL